MKRIFQWLFRSKRGIESTTEIPIKMKIFVLGGLYSGQVSFGENTVLYCTSGCGTYEKCFYDLLDIIRKDRYINIMDHSFTITFINKSQVKEVGQ